MVNIFPINATKIALRTNAVKRLKETASQIENLPGGIFKYLKMVPSQSRGGFGESLVKEMLSSHLGIEVEERESEKNDLVIGKKKVPVDVKLSTIWENGMYTFQNIKLREDNSSIMILVTVDKNSQVQLSWCRYDDLRDHPEFQTFQHKDGKVVDYWLNTNTHKEFFEKYVKPIGSLKKEVD